MRQIVLDTETTGLEPREGHRIIEIGCVELVDRRLTGNNYHQYINPEREVDAGAIEVHGITNEFLADKPVFADVVEDFVEFVRGAELVIHNAPFDTGFIDHELGLCGRAERVSDLCGVLDTLALARRMHPGQKNNLDALCRRYEIDNSNRELHGALLDAEILADVYLAMTGGQVALGLGEESGAARDAEGEVGIRRLPAQRPPLRVVRADGDEQAAHDAFLMTVAKVCGEVSVWQRLENAPGPDQS
ncbi:MAG TPA: DNA polymerase III subunit epsilon [Gammaproteobacteria bacterium]|nr:DNA polymerase III subunit epsilon [Gammaproteobacteria bacterium]